MYEELLGFLNTEECFIEAEAKPSRMRRFIEAYNNDYDEFLGMDNGGLIILQEDADKWGLELRLYVRHSPPTNVRTLGFAFNDAYRNDFSYRLNNKQIVEFIFEQGYRIGFN